MWAEAVESVLEPIQIFGTQRDSLSKPNQPSRVSKKKLQTYQYTDVSRALKQTTGVYVREEDGQGLRPNIGLRGTNPDRSKKVTLLEDGILIGPAPYSAPAAYYVPSMFDTDSIEVYKGFSAIPYGPNSIGGAINYLTPEIPSQKKTHSQAAAGSFGNLDLKLSHGQPTSWGSYFLQGSRVQSDGFKEIDGGGPAGFERSSILGKVQVKQWQLTTGFSEEVSHETYLGLSQVDFDDNPFRRYASSANDKMKWHQIKIQLKNTQPVSENSVLETTLYRHQFRREWYRLDRFNDGGTRKLARLLRDPASDPNYYNVLTGRADSGPLAPLGELLVANNDRQFLSQGLQARLVGNSEGVMSHDFELMARLHGDSIRRNHSLDNYSMTSGRMVRSTSPRELSALNQDRATAVTIGAQDNIAKGQWTLTPAFRMEWVRFEATDDLAKTSQERSDRVWIPGLSVLKKFGSDFTLKGSVNRAASIAGLDSTGADGREEAMNYEVQAKYVNPEKNIEGDLTWFYNDYENITGTCTVSSGCTGSLDSQFNGGKAIVMGLEGRAAKGFQFEKVYVPVELNLTLLKAEFASNFASQSEEWGANVSKGDPLPYIPKIQYALTVGTEFRKFKQDLSVIYQGAMYDQSDEQGRIKIDAYGVVDWTSSFEVSNKLRFTAKVDNVLGREYVVSARPYGVRPGKPRTLMAGFVYAF